MYDIKDPIEIVKIPTSRQQDQAMQNAINERIKNPGDYNFCYRNCANFVIEVLRAGGVDVQDHSAPRELMKELRRKYGSKKW